MKPIKPIKLEIAAALALSLLALPLSAEVTPEQALEIARAHAAETDPDLGLPDTRVRSATAESVIALDVSDPYYLNGVRYWRTYTWFDDASMDPGHNSSPAYRNLENRASQPQPSVVQPEHEDHVLAWLAYWDAESSLDPELRIGTRSTTVHVFWFLRGLAGSQAVVGVDADGTIVRPNLDWRHFPWRGAAESQRRALFLQLDAD